MALLKDSEEKEKMYALHMNIWEKLLEFDESDAETYLENFFNSLDKPILSFFDKLKNLLRKRTFWISIILGITIPPLLFIFFVYIALWIE